jgi:hypothetical protein
MVCENYVCVCVCMHMCLRMCVDENKTQGVEIEERVLGRQRIRSQTSVVDLQDQAIYSNCAVSGVIADTCYDLMSSGCVSNSIRTEVRGWEYMHMHLYKTCIRSEYMHMHMLHREVHNRHTDKHTHTHMSCMLTKEGHTHVYTGVTQR